MKRAAFRGARRSSNAFHRVRDREFGNRPRRFFDFIPARLATPVERLVDPAGRYWCEFGELMTPAMAERFGGEKTPAEVGREMAEGDGAEA